MRVYLDTNFFIATFETTGELAARGEDLLRAGRREPGLLVTSELSLAELLVGPLKERASGRPDEFSPEGERLAAGRRRLGLPPATRATLYAEVLTNGPHLNVMPVDRAILILAAHLRAGEGAPKLPDAIHLATAEHGVCTHIVSGDAKFRPTSRRQFTQVDTAADSLTALLHEIDGRRA